MYEYEYIEIETGGGFWINNEQGTHREVIDRDNILTSIPKLVL